MNVSVIIPVYQNKESIKEVLHELTSTLCAIPNNTYEFVFVDDGSTDGSWEELLSLQETSQNIRLIAFTRNFGQAAAIFAGYKAAQYDIVCNISADLQDPAETLVKMFAKMKETNCEIVIATRNSRDESAYRKGTSQFFYRIIRKLSFSAMPLEGFDIVVATKRAINIATENVDSNPFFQGMFFWTGLPMEVVSYDRRRRKYGRSQWSISKKVKYLIDGVISYSYFPIRIASLSGLIISLAGIIYMLMVIASYLMGGAPFKGWAPIVVLVLFLSGANMAIVGVVGEYIWRIYENTKHRSMYVIREQREPRSK